MVGGPRECHARSRSESRWNCTAAAPGTTARFFGRESPWVPMSWHLRPQILTIASPAHPSFIDQARRLMSTEQGERQVVRTPGTRLVKLIPAIWTMTSCPRNSFSTCDSCVQPSGIWNSTSQNSVRLLRQGAAVERSCRRIGYLRSLLGPSCG